MRLPKGATPGYIKQKADTHEIPLFSCEVKYKHNIQALNEIHWKWINLLKKKENSLSIIIYQDYLFKSSY